jgi:hypothetical protein
LLRLHRCSAIEQFPDEPVTFDWSRLGGSSEQEPRDPDGSLKRRAGAVLMETKIGDAITNLVEDGLRRSPGSPQR